MTVERVFLIGLSGSGKTTVGRKLAAALGWEFADTDEAVEARAGREVKEIFATDGEDAFRDLESEELKGMAARKRIVISTGGGVPIRASNRALLASGLVIWLDITTEGAARRLAAAGGADSRPLLRGNATARLESLFERRRDLYERSDHSIAVDYYDAEQVAARAAALVEEANACGWTAAPDRFGSNGEVSRLGEGVAATVSTATESYPVIVASGALQRVGLICRRAGLSGRAFVLTDSNVAPLHGDALAASLKAAGYRVETYTMPAGEPSKTMATVAAVHDWLLGSRVERWDFMVCLGGGVVTDLGGFAAATVLRGIGFVHVPTTLAGMVDAAIGGKTGVDHTRGKNLIGAFAQPRAVVSDPDALVSLPGRELRAGCAELVKHGFILDRVLVADLERASADLAALASAPMIARSAAIKATVVSDDERETGKRTLLNYGHTVGHAIEAVSGYSRYLHGEAVAVGMRAAGLIGVASGTLSDAEFERQQALIRACGLPEVAPEVAPDAILDAMLGDKKVRRGRINWVLLESLGRAVVRDEVEPAAVRHAVEAVTAP